VVWPLVGFCTSSDVPLMAAIEPDAPGSCRAVPPAPVPEPDVPRPPPFDDDAAVVDVVEADDDPQAARATAATPRAVRAIAFRIVAADVMRRRSAPVVR
jgi:hypothetical protein